MTRVAALWRHPIKSHGREAIPSVALVKDQAMPWDRHWAVWHDNARLTPEAPEWVPCQNFMIGTRVPGLAGIWAMLDEDAARITLRHPDLGALSFSPDTEADRFLTWIAPLCPPDRARPVGIVRMGPRGATDTDYPSVTLMNRASHRAVASAMGRDGLEPERWRGNIWLDGPEPWAERDWIGREIRVGGAVLRVEEEVQRCLHTAANPVTGMRDADTLGTLEARFGHRNFGIYARVVQSGPVALDDKVDLI